MQSSLSSNFNVILPYIAGSTLLINDAVGHKKFKQQTKTRETFLLCRQMLLTQNMLYHIVLEFTIKSTFAAIILHFSSNPFFRR